MKERIFGLETEYGCTIYNVVKKEFVSDLSLSSIINYLVNTNCRLPNYFKKRIVCVSDGFAIWFGNGGKFYIDCSLPEFCTPECSSVRELVIYDKAGEILTFEILKVVKKILGNKENFFLIKNNRGWSDTSNIYLGNDQNGQEVTNGCHENYGFITKSENLQEEIFKNPWGQILISFLITRQIFSGSGFISLDKRFLISQRPDFIYTDFHGVSRSPWRPIVSTKNEPLASNSKISRLHLVCGDSNMSEFSTFLKIGTTHLVIRMLQERFFKNYPRVVNPVLIMKVISEDYKLENKYDLDEGFIVSRASALDIQKFFLDSAADFLSKTDYVDEEEKKILEEWDRVLTSLSSNPQELDNELDWRIKMNLFESYLKKHNCSFNDLEKEIKIKGPKGEITKIKMIERLRALDLAYHEISENGIYNKLAKNGLVKRITSDQEINWALTHPPKETRAYMRGEIVRELVCRNEHAPKASIAWQNIFFNDLGFNLDMSNPFESTNASFSLLKLNLDNLNILI